MVPKIGSIVVLASGWAGDGPYTQTVSVTGATAHSKVDMQLSSSQIAQLILDEVSAMLIENNNGVFTIYANNSTPKVDMTVQVTITETAPVGTSSGGTSTDGGSADDSSTEGSSTDGSDGGSDGGSDSEDKV